MEAPRLLGLLALIGAAGLSACSRPAASDDTRPIVEAAAWLRPPMVETVVLTPGAVAVRGRADPRARVVLRLGEGSAYAASADGQGRFEVRAARPASAVLLEPQVQSGGEVARSPERLLLAGDVAALVGPGEPVRRLDRPQPLQAVDSDGLMMAASGAADPGAEVVIARAGRPPMRVTADGAGRWVAILGPAASGPVRLTVNDRVYDYPGAGPAPGALAAGRVGAGWRVSWSDAIGGAREVWLPDQALGLR